jgi:hypothetical protein
MLAAQSLLEGTQKEEAPQEPLLLLLLGEILKSHALPDDKIKEIKEDFKSCLIELHGAGGD